MRWFVEVSRVDENSSDEKYCVEAKQWQAALQEARRLRGDSGPLSKFSIELLDDGYRAVDPKQKLRFLVAKAPQDAELSSMPLESAFRAEAPHRNGQSSIAPAVPSIAPAVPSIAPAAPSIAPAVPSIAPAVPSIAPAVPSIAPAVPSIAPAAPSIASVASAASTLAAPVTPVAPLAPSVAPAAPVVISAPVEVAAPAAPPLVVSPVAAVPAASSAVEFTTASAEPYAGVPSSALSPTAPNSELGMLSEAAELSAAAPVVAPTTAKSPSAMPPRPGAAARSTSGKPPSGITVPADVIPPAPAVPQGLGAALPDRPALPQNLTQPSPALDMPPPANVLRKRQEEPTLESPISYREVAYVVEPGVSRGSVEALLWASFRDISRELAERAGQKFVQLAVFDHKFEKRPERPPLGTLAWKDWRGNPVVTFPFFDGTAVARASMAPGSIVPVAVVSVSSSAPPAGPAAPIAIPAAPAPAVFPSAPAPAVFPSAPAPAVFPSAPAPAVFPSAPAPAVLAPAPASAPAASATSTPVIPLVIPAPTASASAPAPAAAPASAALHTETPAVPLTRERLPSHSNPRGSRPRLPALRRRAGEDLIGELFETMHDLHFMSGVPDGAEFVLAALESIVPCEGVLIHVFDINTRQFVVVRARGPGAIQALLHRTPDSEPFFNGIMRRPGSVAIHDVGKDARVLGPRWEKLGVRPVRALCGPVRQGGRYLGLIEIANPLGDAPFHQTEQNAIDYVCEQFAEFLANRPIVLDADVILRR